MVSCAVHGFAGWPLESTQCWSNGNCANGAPSRSVRYVTSAASGCQVARAAPSCASRVRPLPGGGGGGGAAAGVKSTVDGVFETLPARSIATTDTVWCVDGASPVIVYERVPTVVRCAVPPSTLTAYPASL